MDGIGTRETMFRAALVTPKLTWFLRQRDGMKINYGKDVRFRRLV